MAKAPKVINKPIDEKVDHAFDGEPISQIIGELAEKIPPWEYNGNPNARIPAHEAYVSRNAGVTTPISREQWIAELKQMNVWLHCLSSLCYRAESQVAELNKATPLVVKLATNHQDKDAAIAEALLKTIIPFGFTNYYNNGPDLDWPCKNRLINTAEGMRELLSFEITNSSSIAGIKNSLERLLANGPSFSQITVSNPVKVIRLTYQALSSYGVTSKLPVECQQPIELLKSKVDGFTNTLRAEMRNYGQTILLMHRMGKFDELTFISAHGAMISAAANLMSTKVAQINNIVNAIINSGHYAGYNFSYSTIAGFIDFVYSSSFNDWEAPW